MNRLNKFYLEAVRKQLIKEQDVYERGEHLILEFKHELNQLEELLDRAKALEYHEKVAELTELMSKVSSNIYEIDEDQKNIIKRMNTYRKILGIPAMVA